MKWIFFLLLGLVTIYSNPTVGQSGYGATRFVKQRGYLFCMGGGQGGEWYFKPSPVMQNPLAGLSKTSFRIWLGTDGFNDRIALLQDSLSNFDSIDVQARWHRDTIYNAWTLYYTYGELEFGKIESLNFPFENIHPCMHSVLFHNKEYYLGCIYFQAEVKSFNRQ